jgi:hypothetical protein
MEGEKKSTAKNIEKEATVEQNSSEEKSVAEKVKTVRVRKNKQTGDNGPIPAI